MSTVLLIEKTISYLYDIVFFYSYSVFFNFFQMKKRKRLGLLNINQNRHRNGITTGKRTRVWVWPCMSLNGFKSL